MPDNSNGTSRLDRIESILEATSEMVRALAQDHRALIDEQVVFRQDLKQLLTAQVLLTDRMSQLTEAQTHTDERLNALISIVDGVIRRPPQ